jgi:AraC-like DNA-binding protein
VKSGLSSNHCRTIPQWLGEWPAAAQPTHPLYKRIASEGHSAKNAILDGMTQVPPARYLQRAKDLVDARYAEPITVDDLAAAAGLSRAHFSRMFTRTFGESPRAYLQTRRLERASALLRYTDRSVADICVMVGLQSVGSFTSSFARVYGLPPAAYRASLPPAAIYARVPSCVLKRDTRRPADSRVKTAHGEKTSAGGRS